jgi:polar amino acid transport system ATP-binding protein
VKTALSEEIFDSGSSTETLMEVHGLYKDFGKLKVLKGINLNVHKSDVLVLIGPSGSGKSTLLRSVNLLEKPTAGQVLFEGDAPEGEMVNVVIDSTEDGLLFGHMQEA